MSYGQYSTSMKASINAQPLGGEPPPSAGRPVGVDRLNRWYDLVPRLEIVVGHRRLPAFRSIGIVGFHVSFLAALLTAMRVELPLLVAVGLSATAALSFFGWALLRRVVAGVEYLVLLEHVWVAIAWVAGYLWLADAPVLAGLDVLTVALAPFLAFGRIGCFTVGCCHGTPTFTGIRYGPDHDHLPPWLVNRRLRPVPLLEAAGLFAIFAVGLVVSGGRAGTATVWFLASYAVLRFGTEALRGDRRPHIGPVSVARIMSMVQLAAAVWLWDFIDTGRPIGPLASDGDAAPWTPLVFRLAPIVLVLVAGWLLTLVRARRPNPLVSHDHLSETWRLVRDAAAADTGRPEPTMATTSQGMTIGVSAIGPSTAHVSFHHPRFDTDGSALLLAGPAVTNHNGIDHAVVDTATSWNDAQMLIDPADTPDSPTGPAVHHTTANLPELQMDIRRLDPVGLNGDGYFTSPTDG